MKYNKNWQPVNLYGEISFGDINKRFPIEISFKIKSLFLIHWIRFVKYPNDDFISIFRYGLRPKWMFWKWDGDQYRSDREFEIKENLSIEEAEKKYGIKISESF